MRDFDVDRHRRVNPPFLRAGAPASRTILSHTAISLAICVLVAAMMPPAIAGVALKTMLLWAAIAIGAVAALRREPLDARRLTRWDEALALILLALLAGLFAAPDFAPDIAAAA